MVTPDSLVPAGSRIGLVAGGGTFPIAVARAARAQGFEVVCAAIRGHACPELRDEVDVFHPIGLLSLRTYVRLFRRHRVHHVTWAGWIRKETLFSWRGIWRHLPDLRAVGFYWRRVRYTDWQSQTLLAALASEFESEGFELESSTELCPELLVEAGVLTKKPPSRKQLDDVAFGWHIAKRMADLDVGQSVSVCNKATIAVEGLEGTDRAILRAGELCKQGFVVVKVAMERHDMRFDVPTIGPETIRVMQRAGAAVLAVEAGKTIVLERDEVVRLADRAGIVVMALAGPT